MQHEQKTPLMEQYHTIKFDYPDCLLLFQVGDFYELFYDDAKKAAAFLGIALTKRGKSQGVDIPLCGVPVHTIDHYITKLVKGGFKVVLCDQLEEPRPGALVKRGVTKVLTPGTLTQDSLLDSKSSSYLCALSESGIVFAELLTNKVFVTGIDTNNERLLENELARFFPDEIIVTKENNQLPLLKKRGYFITELSNADLALVQDSIEWIKKIVSIDRSEQILQADGIKKALCYFYAYIKRTQLVLFNENVSLFWYTAEQFLEIDQMTQKNLELTKNCFDGSTNATLFSVVDNASTSMGSRLIKQWLLRPLVDKEAIEQRQRCIDLFVNNVLFHHRIQDLLQSIGDLERVVGRILLERGAFHDFIILSKAFESIPEIKLLLSHYQTQHDSLFMVINNHIELSEALVTLLSEGLNTDTETDYIIKQGFDQELDGMRALLSHGSQEILALEQAEQEATGIASLKIRYNEIHGYYIETSKIGAQHVPPHYKSLQSLVGKERFTIPALELLHHNIERAKSHVAQREKELFGQIKKTILLHQRLLRRLVWGLAHLDACSGLATTAQKFHFTKPIINTDDQHIMIKQGWHPVVAYNESRRFVPNDTALDQEKTMWIITGPNMGGKSTYLRQVALIVILAHIGSFVPAHSAKISLLDRVFSRVGAGDNLAQGKSTFLIEMEETALICQDATNRSLVILDEVGRGTSTHDGMAIAQSVIEFLITEKKPLTLFATHYHELTDLAIKYHGLIPYYTASTEMNGEIIFLYQIVPGVARGSFGLQVARLAKLPEKVLHRAAILLQEPYRSDLQLKYSHCNHGDTRENEGYKITIQELHSFIGTIDFNTTTPRQAIQLLWKVHDILKQEHNEFQDKN